jgi:hypothetical protein
MVSTLFRSFRSAMLPTLSRRSPLAAAIEQALAPQEGDLPG